MLHTEGVLNGRTIVPMSLDPSDFSGYFLTDHPLNSIPQPNLIHLIIIYLGVREP